MPYFVWARHLVIAAVLKPWNELLVEVSYEE